MATSWRPWALRPRPRAAGGDSIPLLILWDISTLRQAAARLTEPRPLEEFERRWEVLFESDLPPAEELVAARERLLPGSILDVERLKQRRATQHYFRSLWALKSLAVHPHEGVQFLHARLRPAPDLRKVPRLIEDLDAAEFATREWAQQELERFGPPARTLLKAALKKDASLEKRTRIKRLLNKLEEKETERAYECRLAWIIDLLAHLQTPEARQLLPAFADGKYDPAFADEAKKALRRSGEKP